jgi:hypothetical protein
MNSLKSGIAIVAGVLLSGAAWNAALAQAGPAYLQEGTVYTAHSPARNGCPSLDWHIWVGPQDTLSGMISTEGVTAKAFSMTGGIGADKTFHLAGKEIGGTGRTGVVDGKVRDDGVLMATLSQISGPSPCNDKTVYIKWFRGGNDPYDPSKGVAGGAG